VTCNPTENNSEVLGNFSNKIIKIIETVLQLKRDEPDVKIIIFSQWENILDVVARALEKNSILFRSKTTKFHICIEEFKVRFIFHKFPLYL
jgi:E3 ubiquitin-protein ligase SHPRH